MRKTLPLWIALSFTTLATGAALAAPAASPASADPAALHQAIFAPAPDASGLPPGAVPATFFCQQGGNYCVYAQCLCTNQCIPQHVPGTLTGCWPDTHTYSCTCQLQ